MSIISMNLKLPDSIKKNVNTILENVLHAVT